MKFKPLILTGATRMDVVIRNYHIKNGCRKLRLVSAAVFLQGKLYLSMICGLVQNQALELPFQRNLIVSTTNETIYIIRARDYYRVSGNRKYTGTTCRYSVCLSIYNFTLIFGSYKSKVHLVLRTLGIQKMMTFVEYSSGLT